MSEFAPTPDREPTRRQLAAARSLARQADDAAIIYSIDSRDTRRVSVAVLDYANNPEFAAFDGLVLAVVWPNGEIEQ